ncbi:DEAD-box ATP-dependent RNA helicase 50 [Selaginella moellendorffii]|nr:DEAD-box ATP-dependent RNA helicase 50 [Selaginella moellendorffii]|eukprot:XP_002964717.2 DEAD-box ATP-dependent RNA helicase 50 [Selaginella moellendorffii]
MHCIALPGACSPVYHCRHGARVYSLASQSPSRVSSSGYSRSPPGRSERSDFQRFKKDGTRYGDRDESRPRIFGFGNRRRLWNRDRGVEADDDSEKYFVPQDQGDEEDESEESSSSDNSDEEENATSRQQPAVLAEPKTLARDFLKKLRARRLDVESNSKGSLSPVSEEENGSRSSDIKRTLRRKESIDYEENETSNRSEREVRGDSTFSRLGKGLNDEIKETDFKKKRSFGNVKTEEEVRPRRLPSNSKAYDSEDEYFRRDRRERKEKLRGDNMGSKRDEEKKRVDAFLSTKKFQALGASQEMIAALSSLEIVRPSEIQALSYKQVMRGNSCIIADQTGSGKTLAYLAPLVQRLREDEEKGNFSTAKNPRVLVLAPTSELAMQVLSVCRALSTTCPLKSMVATGGFKWKTQVENLASGPDIVVATPGRFLHHLEEETIQLGKLQSVVLDEVDILFEEEEFVEAMQRVRKLASKDVQYIHVTATLPTDVHDKIFNKHPDSVPLLGPSLHLTAPGLNEILVDCSGDDDSEKTPEAAFENKKKELLNLLGEKRVPKTIIFCNKIETCRKVENILNRYDRSGTKLSVLPYHAALSQEARLQSLQDFLSSQKPEVSTFLVCTDRASRGLDSVGVGRVILFDYPRDPSEYIRRVGRTARAGGAGKVFVFVVGKQVSLARKVMARNEKRHPVHAVPGAST